MVKAVAAVILVLVGISVISFVANLVIRALVALVVIWLVLRVLGDTFRRDD